MKKNESQLKTTHVDDYTQLLPVFVYPDDKKSQSMYPDMDLVIEKCSKVIDRHSMNIRKKEHVKWIDDAYQLIGKARFYKQEFGLAEETFLYIYQAYKKNGHRYLGLNWLIRTYIETEQWEKAEEFIDLAEDEQRKYPEEFLGMYFASVADFWLKKDLDYEKAIVSLEEAVKHEKNKEFKRRYLFVLAQIYQNRKDYSSATRLYTQVIKLKPDYVMRFNARINRAISYDVNTLGSEEIKKELRKMLKDSKNEQFKDQIYYALAEIALKEDNEELAIELLRKSAKYSISNNRQKGLSYLKLADLFFDRPAYVNAQAHYDSTLLYLPDDHPEYYDAESKNESLQDLVKNLKTIDRIDSLLALSQLSEKDRRKKVEKMIKELQQEEERKKQAALIALKRQQEEATNQGFLNLGSNGSSRGKWYFYNTTTMAKGQAEFTRIWGQRTLEDNWRRKNSSRNIVVSPNKQDPNNEQQEIKEENQIAEENKYDAEEYLKNIPSTIQEQLEAHGKVAEALFNVGTIFKESFDDYPSAITSFNRVINQYDTSQFNLPSHYQLYRIYIAEQQTDKANFHKQWILDNHPFSEYAYLIKNPDYAKESKASKQKIEEYYEATYKLYAYGLYLDVIQSCEKANQVFKQNHIQAKFDFLKAKAIGHVKTKEEFKLALEKVVSDHPEDTIKDRAQYILDYMARMNNKDENKSAKANSGLYKHNPNDNFMFVMSINEGHPNSRSLKLKLASFNQEFFRNRELDFTTSSLPGRTLYLIRTFENEMDVMRYYTTLKNNPELGVEIRKTQANPYIISLENFRTLFKFKNEQSYLEYFNKKYPG